MISRGFQTSIVLLAFVAALPQPACDKQEQPSALIGRYTLSRDLDGERRVLRIEPSAEYVTECMQATLPVGSGAAWRESILDEALHRELIALLVDEGRTPHYKTDTEASNAVEALVCMQQFGQAEFCYTPQVAVTGFNRPWRFTLHPEVELSEQSQELIDTFLSVHDTCWNAGTPMDGGG